MSSPDLECIQSVSSPCSTIDFDNHPLPMTPHQQRRRAALLADSPEPPPPQSSGMPNPSRRQSVSCSLTGRPVDQVEMVIEAASAGNESGFCLCTRCCVRCCAKMDHSISGLKRSNVWKSILLGQLISLLLCSSCVLCQILVDNYNFKLPSGQSLLYYLLLFVVYFPILCCRRARRSSVSSGSGTNNVTNASLKAPDPLYQVLRQRGLRYFFLAVVDTQANYLIQRAFQYTTLTSVQLLDCFCLPTVLILSWLILRARYKLTHIGGMALALMSVVSLVWIDIDDGKGGVTSGGRNRLIGDMLTLSGSFLTGITFVGLEHSVRFHDPYEFLGIVGLFGSIITAVQIGLLERGEILTIRWELWEITVLLAAFSVAQFVRISCLPLMLKLSSSAGLTLSLLSSDFYSILAGFCMLHFQFHALYLISISLVLTGLIIFSIQPVPMMLKKLSGEIVFGSNGSGSKFKTSAQSIFNGSSEVSVVPNVVPLSNLLVSDMAFHGLPATTVEIHPVRSSSVAGPSNGKLPQAPPPPTMRHQHAPFHEDSM
ncbi:solute carrier family 35 member F2-like [Tigriopus californicus]|nr:solute carrier family 35 member F2-like [Tigriopus californicus]XP_059083665.1 solute carrier family 35 member F2-like [Tigriopus californicus]